MSYSPTLDTTNSLVSLDQVKTALGIEISNAQKLSVIVDGEAEGALGGKYFLIASTKLEYYVWYDVDDGSSNPGLLNKTGIEVDIAAADNAETVATATALAITTVTGFTATADANTVTVENDDSGEVTAPNLGSCNTFKIEEQEAGTTGDASADDLLIDLINDTSWWFNKETHRKLKTQALTEFYDGKGGVVLYLDNPPIAGLTLYQDIDRAFAADTEISSDDYELYEDIGRILLTGDVFLRADYVIKAAYTGGFTTIPYDLQRAAIVRISQNYELNDHHALSTQSRSNDKGGTTSYDKDVLKPVQDALDSYTKVVAI